MSLGLRQSVERETHNSELNTHDWQAKLRVN